jgi:hypothetical protein
MSQKYNLVLEEIPDHLYKIYPLLVTEEIPGHLSQ